MQKAKISSLLLGWVCLSAVAQTSVGSSGGAAVTVIDPAALPTATGDSNVAPQNPSVSPSAIGSIPYNPTFGDAVSRRKAESERLQWVQTELRKRADALALVNAMPPKPSPPPPTEPPVLVGLSGALGRYQAEIWYENAVYHVHSSQLPFAHKHWQVVSISERGVRMQTTQRWPGVGRNRSYTLSAPVPGSILPSLSVVATSTPPAAPQSLNAPLPTF
jgi:hypothetical protein